MNDRNSFALKKYQRWFADEPIFGYHSGHIIIEGENDDMVKVLKVIKEQDVVTIFLAHKHFLVKPIN